MSGIELEPLGDTDVGCIAVPVGKTVIGRGPFLQVQDKRVSRNHGILEVENGELYLTPTHSNPCFFKKNGVGVPVPLPKDQKKHLQDGDVFGLLPDKLFFKANTSKLPNGSAKGVKEDSDNTDKANEKDPDDDVRRSPKKGVVRPPGGKDMTMPLDKNRVLPTWMVQVAKVTTTNPVKTATPKPTPKKTPAAKKTKVESASEEEFNDEEEVPAKKKGRGRPKVQTNTKSPHKPATKSYDESEEEEEDDYVPVKKSEKTKKTARNMPKKKSKESSEEEDDSGDEDFGRKPKKANSNRRGAKRKKSESDYSEEESEVERKPRRRGRRNDSDDEPSTSRPSRSAAKKRGSYVDDFVGAEELSDSEEISDEAKGDSDFILSEDDSGSDWEASRKKKTPKKTWKPKKPPRGKGRRGRPKKGSDDSDSDEEYVPRASQRRASRAATKRFREIDSDDDSEEEYVPRGRTHSRGKPGRVKRKGYDSEEESSEEEHKSPKKRGRKARKDDSDESDTNKKSKSVKRSAASRKSKYDESEEENSEEERRSPKKRGRRARKDDSDESDTNKKSESVKRGAASRKSKYDESEEENSEEEEEEKEEQKSKPSSKKVKKDSESEDDKKDSGKKKSKDKSEDEEEKEKKPKKRKRCMFGKKCYRKNPVHFSDYCHPGDATYDEAESDADDDPIGLGKKFQKMREAATKRKTTVVDRDEDDDGLPNTYDYKDSFIDDEDVSDDDSDPGSDSGSDYVPEDSENIRSLKKEAKGFVKNKKMHKPAHAK